MSASQVNDQLRRVYDVVSDVYDTVGVEFFKPIGRRLVEYAGVRAGEHVLDVGSGRGAVLLPAVEAVGPAGEVVGIDIAPGMVRRLGDEIARRGITNASAVEMDGRDPKFAPQSFDLILSSMSIPMIPDHPVTFANYARLLRPDGRLACTVPGSLSGSRTDFALSFLQRAMTKFIAPEDGAQEAVDSLDAADEVVTLVENLRRVGFAEPTIAEEDVPLVAETGAQFVKWTYTQGLRLFWDMIPDVDKPRLERELAAELEEYRNPDGAIRLSNPVCYVLAQVG